MLIKIFLLVILIIINGIFSATEIAFLSLNKYDLHKELKKGNKIQLIGFGSFETRKRAARKGRNPRTKEEIKIPASTVPAFKAGKALKDAVNK